MRDASPTGGALGQVSERELGFLQSVFGSLDQSQSAEELAYNIQLCSTSTTRSSTAKAITNSSSPSMARVRLVVHHAIDAATQADIDEYANNK